MPRQRLSAAERRGRVLDAAARVYADRGFHDAAVADIAREAGVVPSVIYDHFPSKQQMFVHLFETRGRHLIDRSVRAAPDAEGTLRASVEAFFETVENDPFLWRLFFRDPPADPQIAAAHQALQAEATAAIAALILAVQPDWPGLPDGPGPARSAEMVAEAAKSALNGLAAWWWDHRSVPRDDVVRTAMALLWDGLGALAVPRG